MLESVCKHNAYFVAVASATRIATDAVSAAVAAAAINDDIVVIFRLLTRTLIYLSFSEKRLQL